MDCEAGGEGVLPMSRPRPLDSGLLTLDSETEVMIDSEETQILTGRQAVLEALRHRRRALYRLLISRKAEAREFERIARGLNIPVRRGEPAELSKVAGSAKHQGVVLECGPLPVFALEEILRFDPPGGQDLLVLCVGIEDPRNLGAIARCMSFLGGRALMVPGKGSSPLSASASRTSAGAMESLPIAVVPGAAWACGRLKSSGYQVVGVETGGIALGEWKNITGKIVLVLGGEDRSLGEGVRKRCDLVVSIPGSGTVGSLNVSVASGIVLYHVTAGRRQAAAGGGEP